MAPWRFLCTLIAHRAAAIAELATTSKFIRHNNKKNSELCTLCQKSGETCEYIFMDYCPKKLGKSFGDNTLSLDYRAVFNNEKHSGG